MCHGSHVSNRYRRTERIVNQINFGQSQYTVEPMTVPEHVQSMPKPSLYNRMRAHFAQQKAERMAHAPIVVQTRPMQPVQQGYSAPLEYKTTIRHTPHVIADVLTFGAWVPFHAAFAIFGARKTKAVRR